MPSVWFLQSKEKRHYYIFFKNYFTLSIIFIVKSLQKEQNSPNLLCTMTPNLHRTILVTKYHFWLFDGFLFQSCFNWASFGLKYLWSCFSKNGYMTIQPMKEPFCPFYFEKSLKSYHFRTKIIQVSLKCRICLTRLNLVLYYFCIKCE